MHIRIIGDSFSERIRKEIAELTNESLVQLDSLLHDVEHGTVEFLIDRFPIVKLKARRFWQTKYARDRETKIRSKVVIRKCVSCEIRTDRDETDSGEVSMMFGLHIRGHKVSCTSCEEYRGIHSLELDITVSELDIGISDV